MDESVSNSITSKIKHFAPLFDALIEEVGLVGAAVFGCIWRYCQMQRKVCDASKETIAERCGVSERTVIRWAQVLCEKGYLEDLTPNLRNKPHTYRDTGKIKLEMQVSAVTESQTTEPDEPGPGMPESQAGMTESHPAMTESQSHSDRESDEETSKKLARNKEETNLPAGAEIPPSQPSPVVAFPETDNPDSISNGAPEEVAPAPSEGDYVADVLQRQSAKASFTVPPAAGGADSFSDGPVGAFCAFIDLPVDSLPDKKRGQWGSELRKLADVWQVGADALTACIKAMPKSEFGFKAYSSPYQASFKDDVGVLIGRHIRGVPLVKEKQDSRRKKRDPRRDGGEWTPAELAASAAESLQETPLDVAFLEGG